MKIDIYLSGRFEQKQISTVIAFSDKEKNINFSVLIHSKTKKELLMKFDNIKNKKIVDIFEKLYSISIYWCVKIILIKLKNITFVGIIQKRHP